MRGVLVVYHCPACASRMQRWVASPIPAELDCGRCGQPARRRFGANLLRGKGFAKTTATANEPTAPGGGRCEHADVPGGCVLKPSAARMLSARMRRDNQALEAEIAYQEREIAAGTWDPDAPVLTTFAGGPAPSPVGMPSAANS